MANVIHLKKGLDIHLKGKAFTEISLPGLTEIYSVTPSDFHGLMPKVLVKAGDTVQAGSPVMVDKNHPEVYFVSPVSGIIEEVLRGEKRKLLNILIKADAQTTYLEFPKQNPLNKSGEEVKSMLCTAGLWPYIKQRPYDVIADTAKNPKAIFVAGFDSNPLAPDYNFLLKGQGVDFQTGLDALSRMTEGKVYLNIPAKDACKELLSATRVEITAFEGPHPAGNAGVHINHLNPINKGEVVWTINALEVLFIGRFFNKGVVDLTRVIAMTGPAAYKPCYLRCKPGISIKALIDGNIHKEIPLRIINGNALSGFTVSPDGYLSAYATQLTVLHEGTDVHELFGWIMPRLDKFSVSRTYFSRLTKKFNPKQTYEPDTRILGGERALIMSGEYDRVFPMDILPEQLVRACVTEDLENMENLGIYEIAPEDFALCEYVCTSKLEVQKVIRGALDLLKKENGE